MVESNSRAYTSSNWESIIKVDNGKPKGFVKIYLQAVLPGWCAAINTD